MKKRSTAGRRSSDSSRVDPPISAAQSALSPQELDDEDRERALNERMAEQLRRVRSVPGGESFIAIAEAFHADLILDEYAYQFGDLITGLAPILQQASRVTSHKQQPLAHKQLQALDRIVFPEDYGFDLTDIGASCGFISMGHSAAAGMCSKSCDGFRLCLKRNRVGWS